jgi:hypothetical protein
MNYKKSMIGSIVAFVIATSCCWLPALIIMLGGASSMLAFVEGIGQLSGVFMAIGALLLLYALYLFYRKRNEANSPTKVQLLSTITCPECGHKKIEEMPTNACQFFYECENCKAVLKPKKGDCCVYCSYGSVACPQIQQDQNCCD